MIDSMLCKEIDFTLCTHLSPPINQFSFTIRLNEIFWRVYVKWDIMWHSDLVIENKFCIEQDPFTCIHTTKLLFMCINFKL